MKWMMFGLLLTACASSPETDSDIKDGRDPVCVNAVKHIAKLHGPDGETMINSPQGEEMLDACKLPEAKQPEVQARFQCALKATSVPEVEACNPPRDPEGGE